MKNILFAVSFLFMFGSFANAQDEALNVCDIDPGDYDEILAPLLVGIWKVEGLIGYVEIQGRQIPLPPLPTTRETMSIIGLELSLTWDDGKGPFAVQFVYPDEQEWEITTDNTDLFDDQDIMTSNDFTMATGCEGATFPRLLITGKNMSEEGEVEFHTNLFVVTKGFLYGTTTGRLVNGGGTAKRIISARRM